jgi:hypothetical protein
VGVVVDAGTDEPVAARCLTDSPGSGLAALRLAGFPVVMVPGVPGMVCRIGAVPDPCNGAPAGAYWSYWQVRAGRWVYSELGAASRRPEVGDIEGWAFGSGDPPRLDAGALTRPVGTSASGPAGVRGSEAPPPGSAQGPWGLVAGGILVGALGIWAVRLRLRRG